MGQLANSGAVGDGREVRVRLTACPAAFGAARPAADEVLAWAVDLGCPPVSADELFARLTPEEQTRALRYRIAKAREQFITCRGLLRGLLGACLDVPPLAVPLSYLGSGKPVLDESAGLHFNITHTDGLAVLALARRRVGVDVELVRRVENVDGLVVRYFSAAEGVAFRALSDECREAGFFRGWTTKEAVIKAAGATVGCLADFDVELDPARPPGVHAVRTPLLGAQGWALAEWTAPGGAMIALALEGAGTVRIERA